MTLSDLVIRVQYTDAPVVDRNSETGVVSILGFIE